MIALKIENHVIPLEAFWYHYNLNPKSPQKYSLTISLDETEILQEIVKYSDC